MTAPIDPIGGWRIWRQAMAVLHAQIAQVAKTRQFIRRLERR